MKKISQLVLVIIFVSFVIPSVTFASWWNPFSWFSNKQDKTEILEKKIQELEAKLNSATTTTNTSKIKNIATTTSSTSTKNKFQTQIIPKDNKDIEESITKQKLEEQIILNALKTETDRQNKIETELKARAEQDSIEASVTKLSIDDVSIDTEINSARVSWETSIPSESKIILNGKLYMSENDISTTHYVDINNLKDNFNYDGTITAISNKEWKSKDFSFTTKKGPTTRCFMSETDYPGAPPSTLICVPIKN